jgi:hypothetical protein
MKEKIYIFQCLGPKAQRFRRVLGKETAEPPQGFTVPITDR